MSYFCFGHNVPLVCHVGSSFSRLFASVFVVTVSRVCSIVGCPRTQQCRTSSHAAMSLPAGSTAFFGFASQPGGTPGSASLGGAVLAAQLYHFPYQPMVSQSGCGPAAQAGFPPEAPNTTVLPQPPQHAAAGLQFGQLALNALVGSARIPVPVAEGLLAV